MKENFIKTIVSVTAGVYIYIFIKLACAVHLSISVVFYSTSTEFFPQVTMYFTSKGYHQKLCFWHVVEDREKENVTVQKLKPLNVYEKMRSCPQRLDGLEHD